MEPILKQPGITPPPTYDAATGKIPQLKEDISDTGSDIQNQCCCYSAPYKNRNCCVYYFFRFFEIMGQCTEDCCELCTECMCYICCDETVHENKYKRNNNSNYKRSEQDDFHEYAVTTDYDQGYSDFGYIDHANSEHHNSNHANSSHENSCHVNTDHGDSNQGNNHCDSSNDYGNSDTCTFDDGGACSGGADD